MLLPLTKEVVCKKEVFQMENEELKQEEQLETAEQTNSKKKEKKEKKGMPILLQLVLLVVLVFILRNVMGTVLVKGSSMEPNFYHGDLVFINKLSTAIGSPEKGDIVICIMHEDDTEENIIKRVIGLPGDEIDIVENEDDEDVHQWRVDRRTLFGRTYDDRRQYRLPLRSAGRQLFCYG